MIVSINLALLLDVVEHHQTTSGDFSVHLSGIYRREGMKETAERNPSFSNMEVTVRHKIDLEHAIFMLKHGGGSSTIL